MENKLIDLIKKHIFSKNNLISDETYRDIINTWEENRCSTEYVAYTKDKKDFCLIVEQYGIDIAIKCHLYFPYVIIGENFNIPRGVDSIKERFDAFADEIAMDVIKYPESYVDCIDLIATMKELLEIYALNNK